MLLRRPSHLVSMGLAMVAVVALTGSMAMARPGTVQLQSQPPTNPATPGDALAVVAVSVPSPSGVSVAIAVDCDGNLYYTNYTDPVLHKMTAAGVHISSLPLHLADGSPISIGEISWSTRHGGELWGATDSSPTNMIYRIAPATGLCSDGFPGQVGITLTDGLAFDDSDESVWHSTDVSTTIDHFSVATGGGYGSALGVLTPVDGAGSPLGSISGVCVGIGDVLYIGRDGLGLIQRVDKSTGILIDSFASPGGRDEGLECDPINFAPLLALWSKDAYDNMVTAIEVEAGTCACGGATANDASTWGNVKSIYK